MPKSEARSTANELLELIRAGNAQLESLEAAAEREMKAVREKYGERIGELASRIKDSEKALIAHMKRHKREFFAEGDRLALAAGVLCHMEEPKVSIPRDALEQAERWGLTDAIKISKSLDRAVVEHWPVERLTLIGAVRKLKESFSYELADVKVKGKRDG